MKISSSLAFGLAAMALTVSSFSANAAVTVGTSDSGNCYPFSCMASDGGSKYQQIYSSSAFTGTTSVGSISFFRSDAGLMDSASYNISFYYTPSAVNGLSSTSAANLGSLLSEFGTFNIGGTMPAELTLDGTNFSYDPTLGNLLMDVSISNLTENHKYESFFQADYTGLETRRFYRYNNSSEGAVGDGAIVTRFNEVTAVNDVPEPSSIALLSLALAGMVVARRRKQA